MKKFLKFDMSLNNFQNKSIDIYGLMNKKEYCNIQRNK